MSSEANKALVRRLFREAWNKGNLAVIDEMLASDYVLSAYPEGRAFGEGAEGLKRLIATNRAHFPDGQIKIEDQIAEGDKIVTRNTAQVTTSIATTRIWIDHITSEQIVVGWVDWDRLGLFQQLGLILAKGHTAT
jgi:predicted ester cyclase